MSSLDSIKKRMDELIVEVEKCDPLFNALAETIKAMDGLSFSPNQDRLTRLGNETVHFYRILIGLNPILNKKIAEALIKIGYPEDEAKDKANFLALFSLRK